MTLGICKNDRCHNIVPPRRDGQRGRPREYCTTRCQRRHHARLAYQREQSAGSGQLFINDFGRAQISRSMPRSAAAAEKRYKEHLAYCPIHERPCPAVADPYGRKRICLIAAVFVEDWMQLRDAERGRPLRPRVSTTRDGSWMADLTPEERKAELERSAAPIPPATVDPKMRESAFQFGGARRPDSPYASEEIARLNEGLPSPY